MSKPLTLEEIIAEREACGGCPQCPPMPGEQVIMEYENENPPE